jgi:hypothetical protein
MIEKKMTTKQDLKMTDLLRYYVADGQAAKDLMFRRIKVSRLFPELLFSLFAENSRHYENGGGPLSSFMI